jgi:hypothetical protein
LEFTWNLLHWVDILFFSPLPDVRLWEKGEEKDKALFPLSSILQGQDRGGGISRSIEGGVEDVVGVCWLVYLLLWLVLVMLV